jgi:hypothetical protein
MGFARVKNSNKKTERGWVWEIKTNQLELITGSETMRRGVADGLRIDSKGDRWADILSINYARSDAY